MCSLAANVAAPCCVLANRESVAINRVRRCVGRNQLFAIATDVRRSSIGSRFDADQLALISIAHGSNQMGMEVQFAELCRDASLRLGLPDSEALGRGEVVEIDEVDGQMSFDMVKSSAQFYVNLGDPKPDAASTVYENLLELQCMFAGQIDAMFLRDPVNDRLLFMVWIPLRGHTADTFATALRATVTQVRKWQNTILAGRMIDYTQELDKLLGKDTPPPIAQFA
jgi:hypothetical protein